MSFLCNGTTYGRVDSKSKGRKGLKTGPGRGRHQNESIEDGPPRLTNATALESRKRADRAVSEHPMSHRLKQKQLRHLRRQYHSTMGPEFAKVMASNHPGKHRSGKVRSM